MMITRVTPPGTPPETPVAEPDVPDPHSEDAGSSASSDEDGASIAGDTVGASTAASNKTGNFQRRQARAKRRQWRWQPKITVHGDPSQSRRESSWWNEEPEVGNFGLFCGNWGKRGSAANELCEKSDQQIRKCPVQVLVLAETTESMKEMLQLPPVTGESKKKTLL